ncbi:MAG: ABC transporter permease [Burkholderiales bacterium]|nr:ABC transporter permease [Anaerolineae bacterium]
MLLRMILLRLGLALITLLSVSVFIFITTEILPGDIAARVLGRESSEEARAVFRERLRLDRPVTERYLLWLGGAVRGDFGHSLVSERTVSEVVFPRMANTFILATYAFIIYVPVTLILSILAAIYHDRIPDTVISTLNLIGLSTPEFVIGTILIYVFAVSMRVFPVMSQIQRAENLGEIIYVTTLPAVTLSIAMAVYSIRMLRDNLIEVLNSEYVRMAILKGLPRYRVVLFHALPNAVVPALNTMALNLAYLIGGVVVVEQVFVFQGLGTLLVESVFLRDAPIIEAVALIVSGVYILANLFADVMAIVLNPRLRAS